MKDYLDYLLNMELPEPIRDLQALQIWKHRRVWQPFMEKYNCQKIAEIGVFRGENFRLMIKHHPQVAVAVDIWKDTGNFYQNDAGFSQGILDAMAKVFIEGWGRKPGVQVLREYSSDACRRFPDGYFDLIYIDADHSFGGCLEDIELWTPKVRKGGFVTGDDYTNRRAPRTGVKFGVIEAVNKYFGKRNMTVYELPRHGWVVLK